MMKKSTKLLSAMMAGALLLSTAACGTPAATPAPGSTASGGSQAASSSKADSKPAPIKWLTTGDSAGKPVNTGDRIVAAINEKLGITLSVQVVPEGNVEKVNVAMASGDFPDVVTGAYGTSATQQWIDDGMVIAMNDYMADRPNIKNWLETDFTWTAVDGKYYGVPFITQYQAANALILMRQDWLDKVELSYPTTLEEMKTVLMAFTNNDPDGNGKKDTYGYTSDKPKDGNTPFDWVFFAHGAKNADYALDKDGNVIPFFEFEGYVPAMKYIKDLWDSGCVDPELMLNDNPKKEEKFYQGRVGSMLCPLFRNLTRHENSLKQLFPEAGVAFNLPPKGTDGSFGLNKQGKGGMLTAVTTACKTPDKAMDFIEFMVSEEGNNLLRLGIEGTHYTKEGDKLVWNEAEREKDSFAANGWAHALAWGSFYWPLESGYLPETEPNRERVLESTDLAGKAQLPNLIKQKTPLEVKSLGALNDIYIQYFTDMLSGKIGIEEGVAKLSTAWRSQGGDALLAELNQVYKATK